MRKIGCIGVATKAALLSKPHRECLNCSRVFTTASYQYNSISAMMMLAARLGRQGDGYGMQNNSSCRRELRTVSTHHIENINAKSRIFLKNKQMGPNLKGKRTKEASLEKEALDQVNYLDVVLGGESNGGSSWSNGSSSGKKVYNTAVSGKVRSKLLKPLKAPPPKVLDIASEGLKDATGEDLLDNLTESLTSAKFSFLFRGVQNSAQVLEFVDIDLNRDCSNAVIYWRSSPMEALVQKVYQTLGEEEAMRVLAVSSKNVNKKLQKRIGMFRTNIMRKMSFKKVPNILFKPKIVSPNNLKYN